MFPPTRRAWRTSLIDAFGPWHDGHDGHAASCPSVADSVVRLCATTDLARRRHHRHYIRFPEPQPASGFSLDRRRSSNALWSV